MAIRIVVSISYCSPSDSIQSKIIFQVINTHEFEFEIKTIRKHIECE